MTRAHEIAKKKLEGDYQARLSLALKKAWEEAKEMEELNYRGLTEESIRRFAGLSEDEEINQDKIDFAWEEAQRILKAQMNKIAAAKYLELVNPRELELGFGKYKGDRLEEIYNEDKSYFRWIKNEFSSTPLGRIAREAEEKIEEEKEDDDFLLI